MENNKMDSTAQKESLLDCALTHVAFDGWSDACFLAAAADAGIEPAMARVICPRGAVDLAVAYHKRGDAAMVEGLAKTDLAALRYRDRVALAVKLRLQAADVEIVRRGAVLFSLPVNAAIGAGLIWGTADAIWRALGDTSDDINWYSKRATLAGVYSSTVLFWLGDMSGSNAATWDFLERRIDDVMRVEKIKAQVRDNPFLSRVLAGPMKILDKVRAPASAQDDLPGRNQPKEKA
ncbi:MAG: COQ9 family protein [Paracoccaceae bacterium]|nr:COQ9 family protein [Paracoccaceae bacterium]